MTRSATASSNSAWLYGLDLAETGYFWEAHEVLEAVWLNAPPNSPERKQVQAVIQLANAALKSSMGRPNAAQRLCAMARALSAEAAGAGLGQEPAGVMGLNSTDLNQAIDHIERAVRSGERIALRL